VKCNLLFGDCVLDPDRATQPGIGVIAIGRKSSTCLLSDPRNRAPRCHKDEVLDAVWEDESSSESNLTSHLNAVSQGESVTRRRAAPDPNRRPPRDPFRRRRSCKPNLVLMCIQFHPAGLAKSDETPAPAPGPSRQPSIAFLAFQI